jgi:hypothetical protein
VGKLVLKTTDMETLYDLGQKVRERERERERERYIHIRDRWIDIWVYRHE